MRMNTQARSILGYGALLGGFVVSLTLCLFATSTVRDLRAYHAATPQAQTYVFSYRAGAPGPEMSFPHLLALHIFLQWFGLALAFLFSAWILKKMSREMQEKRPL